MKNSITKNLKEKTFADVCCGIGGFRLALEEAGARCVFASETDKFACQVYKDNFGQTPMGDITKIEVSEIPDIDILCAGFPCQPFSVAGKQEGFKDAIRGTMYFYLLNIIEAKQPEIVFLENVTNLEKHDNGNTFSIIKESLEQLGYTVHYKNLNASDYGVPQNRNRLYIIAFHNDVNLKAFEFPTPIELTKCVSDILEPEANIPDSLYKPAYDMVMKSDVKMRVNKPNQVAFVGKNRQGERIYSIEGTAITLTADGGGRFSKTGGYIIDGKPRKLSARECARLMGFPDDFVIDTSSNQATKQFGNSVVVDVLQHIIANIEYED